MKLATIKIEISYNAPFYYDDKEKLEQAIKDLDLRGIIKWRTSQFKGCDHIVDNMIIEAEKVFPD